MRRFRNKKGQDLVEYGALLVIFVMFAILAINAIRSSTGDMYGDIESGVTDARKISDQAAADGEARAKAAKAAEAAGVAKKEAAEKGGKAE